MEYRSWSRCQSIEISIENCAKTMPFFERVSYLLKNRGLANLSPK